MLNLAQTLGVLRGVASEKGCEIISVAAICTIPIN